MKSICPEIDTVINLSLEANNSIKEKSEDWSNAKEVFFMKKKLNQELRNKIQMLLPDLEYWEDSGSPHNEPDEGFFCNKCKVGISYPALREVIR